MSSNNPADYIIGEAKRKELVNRFLDIVMRTPGYYLNFLRINYLAIDWNRTALKSEVSAFNKANAKANLNKDALYNGAFAATPKAAEVAAFAGWIANRFIPQALGKMTEQPKLEAPIVMLEQSAAEDMHFYRVYGGGKGKAGSAGNWWMDEKDMIDIVRSAQRYGESKGFQDWQIKALAREFMLTSAYVYSAWNDGLRVARMTVPAGMRVPVIVAKGSWRTFAEAARPDRKDPNKPVFDPASEGTKQGRVFQSGMLPRSGLKQWFLPVFDSNWIKELPNAGPHWPFDRKID